MNEPSNVLAIEKVIRLTILKENPNRVVIQYYNMDGVLIFELDPVT